MAKSQKPSSTQRTAVLSQAALTEWLDRLAETSSLIAPRLVSGVLLYRKVSKSAEIAWGFSRPVMSAKDVFFPPTEQLFTIQKTGQEVSLRESQPEGETILFGVRPCDARGVRLLDALFLDTEPVDPYYARRRANTTLIGLACQEVGATCFCTSTGGAPDDERDMDVMLVAVNGGYALKAITDKGKALTAGLALTISDQVEAPPRRRPAVPGQMPAIPWPAHFTDSYWARISERCLSCRACAYVCPTCRCFTVRDEMTASPAEFERIRCWDSCGGENYRRIAGGHKGRAEKGERLRNRFFCKFYYYPEQYSLKDTPACTGCGRCIDVCPVGVDITEVLMDLRRST
ncbi:MAG: 4Fe-4S dicluster domain-containing protein [Anaerolineales bacterium]|jgi:ferredoxin